MMCIYLVCMSVCVCMICWQTQIDSSLADPLNRERGRNLIKGQHFLFLLIGVLFRRLGWVHVTQTEAELRQLHKDHDVWFSLNKCPGLYVIVNVLTGAYLSTHALLGVHAWLREIRITHNHVHVVITYFNGMSTHLGLFYICIFIFTYFVLLLLKSYYCYMA